MRVCVCVRAQAAHLASVRALQTERSVTHTIELADLHTYGSSTDRLHRAMAAMQSPRSQTAYVRLQRPVSRDANFNSARPSPVSSVNRHRLGTYSSTPPVKEVLYQPSRDDRVRKLLDPTVREHNHGRAYEGDLCAECACALLCAAARFNSRPSPCGLARRCACQCIVRHSRREW